VAIVKLPYGVGVVASSPWAAFQAKAALEVTWSGWGRARGFHSDKAVEAYAESVQDDERSGTEWDRTGDVEGALLKAATSLEAEYRCDYAYHAQIEPLNAVAAVSEDGRRAEIWCGTQSQTMAVAAAANALAIPAENVVLHSMLLGGGFGRRGHRDEEFITDAVLLADAVKRPVKVIWTREDDLRNGRFRPMSVHRLRAGLNSHGELTAWEHRVAGDEIMPFQDPVRYEGWGKRDLIAILGTELKPYEVPHRISEQLPQRTGVRTSSLRAIGYGPNKFAAEAFLDEVARKRGADPVEFRLDLLKNAPRSRRVIEAAARRSGWGRAREDRGFGFAFVDYAGTQVAGVVEISLNVRTGVIRAHNVWIAIDPGIAVQPDNVVAQTEGSVIYGLSLALMERITIADGAVQEANFYDYPILRLEDAPRIEVELISSDVAPTGVGQMATPLIAPALSNAVAALTGVRLRHTPMTAERVLAALHRRSEQ
jgi:isoquinoline 1-oxidoreductase beta subunit